jgi:Ser/Thr protein kinase RdoA (MazF antagonist)
MDPTDQPAPDASHPYERLTPDLVIDAVESAGYLCDARLLALNSYENRVYQVGIEDDVPIIAKFYRPHRWSQEQILEEHSFAAELVEADISVVAPLAEADGRTLHHYEGFTFALFRRQGGHPPELDNPDSLLVLGRTLGRIHAVGRAGKFQHRIDINVQRMAVDSYEYLSEHFVPRELLPAYTSLCEDLITRIKETYQPQTQIRVHGDCHVGNVLWRDDTAHFVDLDDCVTAPAVQDLWMFISGDRQQQTLLLSELLDGYQEFCDFEPRQLGLIESLRTMRIMHYAAWLGRRWDDPAFPRSFTWFNDARYWSDHILELREQMSAFDEPPLTLY